MTGTSMTGATASGTTATGITATSATASGATTDSPNPGGGTATEAAPAILRARGRGVAAGER